MNYQYLKFSYNLQKMTTQSNFCNMQSFIKTKNRIGPITLPCGTPLVIRPGSEKIYYFFAQIQTYLLKCF